MTLKRILSPKEEKERADKALELNGYVKPPYDPNNDPEIKRAKAALYNKNGMRRATLTVTKVPYNITSPVLRHWQNEKARKAMELNL
jgi:16S rRNA A1518/A1519 N6-dimethyltransferase RsmA/KsgA/DIM1 with predicted DNA glycosylase/AP lyase activity